MKGQIDLKNYQIRTDLAIELINDNIDTTSENIDDVKVTTVYLNKNEAKKINKKEGTYITIEFDDVTDYNHKEKLKDIFSNNFRDLLKTLNIKENASCLIIGLGNDKSTPDSLGPLVIEKTIVTSHLFKINKIDDGFRKVSAIAPGVMGQTGIETSDLIKSVVNTENPDFLIVIDALASQSIERVNKTIQITDTGIHPGSGIGNSRKEISKEILGIPVIAIGIPTVVDAVTIVSDTINYMYKHFSYTKSHINSPANKLSIGSVNYLKKDIKISKEDREKFFGLVGQLDEIDVKQLIYEVLSPIGYNLMVTPKEVDFIMEKLGDVVANGLNRALHQNVENI